MFTQQAEELLKSSDPEMVKLGKHYLAMTNPVLKLRQLVEKTRETHKDSPFIEKLNTEAINVSKSLKFNSDDAFALAMNIMTCDPAAGVLMHIMDCKQCTHSVALFLVISTEPQ
jgi:hypothetical protein